MTLEPATILKLGKLIPRLASEHDGEVVATVRAIRRVLESAGASLHDLSSAFGSAEDRSNTLPVSHEDVLRVGPYLLEHCELNDREREFVLSLVIWARRKRRKFTVTEKQAAWWAVILSTYIHNEA